MGLPSIHRYAAMPPSISPTPTSGQKREEKTSFFSGAKRNDSSQDIMKRTIPDTQRYGIFTYIWLVLMVNVGI